MDRHQRRGTGRVDDEAGAAEVQEVGQEARGEAVRVEALEAVDLGARALHQLLPVVNAPHAEEETGRAAFQASRRQPRMLDRLPGNLLHHLLLGVHAIGEVGRVAEEPRVGIVDPLDEPALAGDDLARGLRVGIEVLVGIPAVRRNERHGVDAVAEVLPELPGRPGPARETAADPDHRDRLVLGRLDRAQPGLQLVHGAERTLQRGSFGRHRSSSPSQNTL